MAEDTWYSNGSDNWNGTNAWNTQADGGGTGLSNPDADAHVVIQGSDTITITAAIGNSIKSLTVEAGSQLTGHASHTITISAKGTASFGTNGYAVRIHSGATLGSNVKLNIETQADAWATFNGGTGTIDTLTINHSSCKVILQGAATMGSLTITAGELDTHSNNYALTVTGDVTIAASGTLTCNSSTVIVNSFTISSGGTLSAPDASGSLTLNGTLSAWSFQNNSTNFSHNNGTITQTAAGHIKSVSSNPMYNFTLNSSSSDSHAAVFRPSSGTDCVIAANNVTVTRGLLQVNTHSHTMSMGSLTIGSTGTFEASSTTTTITGGASVTTNRCLQDSGTFTHNDGTLNITGTNWGGSNYAHIHTASGIELGNVTINAGGADAKYYQFRCGSGTFNFNNVYVKSGEMRDYNNNNTFNIRGNLDIGTRGAGGTNAAFFGSDARDNAYTTKFIVAGLVTTYTNGQFHVAYGTDGTDGCKIGGLRNVGGTVYGDTA